MIDGLVIMIVLTIVGSTLYAMGVTATAVMEKIEWK